MEIIMKTFIGSDGNYTDIPLSEILDRMTDAWINDEVTGENISELRDACRKLLETAHNSDYLTNSEIPNEFESEQNVTPNQNQQPNG